MSYSFISFKFFSRIFDSNRCSMAEIDNDSLNGTISNTIFPASTFARSSMSFNNTISASPLSLMAVRYSFCSSVRVVLSTTFVNPMMAFIGVRISWLIFDKNCCLAFMAFSAKIVALSALLFASSASSVAISANTLARRGSTFRRS